MLGVQPIKLLESRVLSHCPAIHDIKSTITVKKCRGGRTPTAFKGFKVTPTPGVGTPIYGHAKEVMQ